MVAYQGPDTAAELLALPPYSTSEPVAVPTLLWLSDPAMPRPLIGRQVLEAGLAHSDGPQLHRDFKRQIGALPCPAPQPPPALPLRPEQAGALLLRHILTFFIFKILIYYSILFLSERLTLLCLTFLLIQI